MKKKKILKLTENQFKSVILEAAKNEMTFNESEMEETDVVDEGNNTVAFKSMRKHVDEVENVSEVEESLDEVVEDIEESEMATRAGSEGKIFEGNLQKEINRFKQLIK